MAGHFKELGDVSKLLEYLFSKPNKIYCRTDDDKIKLEVFSNPPKHWGILELRKQNGCYSIVSAYPRDNQYSVPKGELIWEYSSQAVSLQAANSKPRPITSGIMPQEAQEELATKSESNINPLKIKVNPVSEKNLQNPENASGDLSDKSDISDVSDELRFSLEEYSESEQDDIVAVLQPFVGRNMDMEPEKYREYLRSKGIQIPDQDADIFFRMAVMANDKAARERANRLRDQWIKARTL